MTEQESQLPLMVILDNEGYLICAGAPHCIDPKDIIDAAKEGGTVKTITLKEYEEAHYKWIYSKPKNLTNV